MGLFTEITMINYNRSLAERLKARKFCGPYLWHPSEPGKGIGFYQSPHRLAAESHGSSFDLRLELANDHLHHTQLGNTNGYFIDDYCDQSLIPIIALLPNKRGFLAGYTMGEGMIASLDATIYEFSEEAARAAHSEAESAAEDEREYRETEDEEEEE